MERGEEYFQKKIIIIGAGIAGLACASCLRDHGFENVLILEAKDRIGGRTYTVNHTTNQLSEDTENDFIEFGAEWIHGEDGNVIHELAHSKGLINESAVNYFETLTNFNLLFSEEEAKTINSLMDYLDSCLYDSQEEVTEDVSVSDFLDKVFTEYLEKQKDLSMVEFLKGAYDWYNKIHCELNGCTSLSLVSARLLNQYKECEGLQTVQLKYGFSSVLNLMYDKIPSDTILINHMVEKIDWTDFKTEKRSDDTETDNAPNCKENVDLKIKVFCNNGDVFEADHVVITIPLGSLKKQFNTLFIPALSENKIKAIQSVGFGTVNKIYLEFSDPFWEPSTVYHVLWSKSLDEIFESSDESSKTWVKCINRFAYTPGHPNMLCGWVVGEGAITMESLSSEEVTSHCMELLEKIAKKQLPKPKRIFRSKWHSDPETSGSYSYLSIDSNKESLSQIAKPEISNVFCAQHPVLQFAGEATHSHHYSTVHGAYETGIREAQRLYEHFRNCALRNISKTVQIIYRSVHSQNIIHQNMRILVIGAGITGLTAALSLYQKGFMQVSVLEAQDYIGGRIRSLVLDNNYLELGAQWIHGNSNPLYDFSVANELLCDPSDEPSYEGKGLFCTSNGEVVEMSVVNEVKDIVEKTKSNLEEGLYDSCFASRSAESFFSESFNSYITKNVDDSLNSVRKGLFNWFLKFEVIDNSCDNLAEVAVQGYSEWCDVPDECYHINLKNGFSSVINTIYHQLPPGCVYLKKAAKRINWQKKIILSHFKEKDFPVSSSENFPALVECEDGENIVADAVILTASVGYIKENMDKLFEPTLPDEKVRAFANVGYGTINKIYLIYNVPFWGMQDHGFQLVWTSLDEELKILLKEHPWINGITGFDIVKKQPNILLGWIGGVEAKMIENVDVDIISSVCTKLLRKFLHFPDIPYPAKTIRTSWYTNNYVRGSYSYRSLKFYESESRLEDLQLPLFTTYEIIEGKPLQWPVVYFAGEALDENSFSSVHGAFQSGLKVADDLELLCSQMQDRGYEDLSVYNHFLHTRSKLR